MPITEKTLQFLGENRLRDSRDWFAEHKEEYKALVEAPLLALSLELGAVAADIDPLITCEPRRTLSRIWRDIRFSKDKTTFREVMWLVFRRGKGMEYPAYFFEFSPQQYRYGCGYYSAPPPVMALVRERVLAGDKRWRDADRALAGFTLAGEEYKRPRYPEASEEKRRWLNRKGLSALVDGRDAALLFSDGLGAVIGDAFRRLAPFYHFLLDCHMQFADGAREAGRGT